MTTSIPYTPEILDRLRALLLTRKFTAEFFYPGAPTEDIRVECERRVNQFLEQVISLLLRGAPGKAIVAEATELETKFQFEDTEEHERAGDYIAEAMRIIGIRHGSFQDGEDPEERDRYFGFKPK